MIDTCEIRVAVGEVEIPQNQIPPLAPVKLRPAVYEFQIAQSQTT
jgi:hypothetical protein